MNDNSRGVPPAALVAIEKIYKDADERIAHIENQIAELPKDNGPQPTPSWGKSNYHYGSVMQKKIGLERTKQSIASQAKIDAAKIYSSCSPDDKATVISPMSRWRNPDFKDKREEKTIEQSEEFLKREQVINAGKVRMQSLAKEKVAEQNPSPEVQLELSQDKDLQKNFPDQPQINQTDKKEVTPSTSMSAYYQSIMIGRIQTVDVDKERISFKDMDEIIEEP